MPGAMSIAARTRGPSRLAAEGLGRTYDGRLALDVPSFELAAGRTCAVIGPSGSGKSTLVRLLGLLERPDRGRVVLDGREVALRDHTARREIVTVFQRPYLFTNTVFQNVAYGLKLRKVPATEMAARVGEALERMGLAGLAGEAVTTLSGGEAQRVALARALVLRPRVLLLDEPFSSLDPVVKRRVAVDFLRAVAEDGITALYVTHDQDEAMMLADDVALMRDGRLTRTGPADGVMGLPRDDWSAEFLGMEPPVEARVALARDGVIEAVSGDVRLTAIGEVSEGALVVMAVRPEDVTLFPAGVEIPPSSARNRIDGIVSAVRVEGATTRIVVARGSVRIAATVSNLSADELGLGVGVPVVALFKATATRAARKEDA